MAMPGSRTRCGEANDTSNPGLPRMAFKMATGSGKTVVMAMLIAWHTLNKRANPQDARFSDTFLIVTPAIANRDRLRVLLPNDPENYYPQRDIVPAQFSGPAWTGQDRHHQLSQEPLPCRRFSGCGSWLLQAAAVHATHLLSTARPNC